MEICWNKMDLRSPPYRSWDISVQKYDSRIFIQTIEKILVEFKTFIVLNKEAALLSRLIYRMKSKFRNDKGFKYMEKVNRALLNYLNMSLENEYKLLIKYTKICNGIVNLPSRQNIEYILIRTQGLAKLMCHIELIAKAAGNALKTRIHTGQSWPIAMIAYAVISRIWILSQYFVKKLCVWYNSIYKYVKIFKIVGIPWLPDNYLLLKNLTEWLDVPWLTEDREMLPMKGNLKKSIFNLIEVNNGLETSLKDMDMDVINENSIKEMEEFSCLKSEFIHRQDNDIGKPISRSNFGNNVYKTNKKTINKFIPKQDNDIGKSISRSSFGNIAYKSNKKAINEHIKKTKFKQEKQVKRLKKLHKK